MPATPPGADQPTRRRDPEARRRAIVQAAADLLVAGGADLTHRRVAERAGVPLGATTYYFSNLDELREAGLQLLADEIDEALAESRRQLADAKGDPAVLAAHLHAYLGDRDQVRADAALYGAAIQNPRLRPLALRWSDGMVALLTEWTDPATARLVTAFADGVVGHAMLSDEPMDLGALTRGISALMTSRPGGER
jgi:DNA-binding transcriptional regulator YbjK